MTPLEPGFEPTEVDVICSRGRSAFNHEGNVRFRGIVAQNVDRYRSATSKQQKSAVVNSLLEEFKATSRFVRKQEDGKWVEVPEHVAKEKIGQGFRDILHTEYRSSTKSKVKLRRERRRRQRGLREQENEAVVSVPALRRSNSCETLEPLPLDESLGASAPVPAIYDLPFAFAQPKDDGQAADDDGGDKNEEPSIPEEEKKPAAIKRELSANEDADQVSGGDGEQRGSAPTFVTPKSPPGGGVVHHHRSHSLDSRAPAAGVSPARCPDSWEQYRRPYYPPPMGYSPTAYGAIPHYPRYYSPTTGYRGGGNVPPPPPYPPGPGTHYHPPPDVPSSPHRRPPDWDPYSYSYGRSPPPPRPQSSGSYYSTPYRSWGDEPAAARDPAGYSASESPRQPGQDSQARRPEEGPVPQHWSDYRNPPYPYPPYPPYDYQPPPPPPRPPPPPPRW